jgi:bacillithiol system protein YtxJ
MTIKKIHDENELESILMSDRAVLLKHSPICGLSAAAMKEVQRFAGDHPDVPVFVLDVRAQRQLSRDTAVRLDIRHESPQAIVIRDGAVAWHGAHLGITAEKLSEAFAND